MIRKCINRFLYLVLIDVKLNTGSKSAIYMVIYGVKNRNLPQNKV